MKKLKKNKGITLIALVITIIVLLILAGVSIATLTGKNGILTKADTANKNTDIVETKEQIKIEIMGTLDGQKTDYTNQDVINAVKKITGNTVTEDTKTVQSKKKNDVDISDLWISGSIKFIIAGEQYEVQNGTTWEEFLLENLDEFWGMAVEKETGLICGFGDDGSSLTIRYSSFKSMSDGKYHFLSEKIEADTYYFDENDSGAININDLDRRFG